ASSIATKLLVLYGPKTFHMIYRATELNFRNT
ncbi:MAG: hypothetical protein ACI9TH_003348, partial [Kiritimatiellia bacterium]